MAMKQSIPPRLIKTGKQKLFLESFISQVDNELIVHTVFHNAITGSLRHIYFVN